jgi:putative aminopeptidase FrvX
VHESDCFMRATFRKQANKGEMLDPPIPGAAHLATRVGVFAKLHVLPAHEAMHGHENNVQFVHTIGERVALTGAIRRS